MEGRKDRESYENNVLMLITMKYITEKGNAVVRKVWSIGERKFKDDWEKMQW